ncbi:nucleotidyltransferase family protein [Methanocrinis sp.]|uniref:nucleotidyltransferase family protein n=1 Tax=Methanocrinis sp. TaxID=3101522 RepID=UPI003D139F65
MEALKILKEHESEIRRRFGVKRIGIFGSHARGEEKESSDVDVLVEFVEPSFDNFMDLAFFLQDLFGREVDLVTTGGLSPHIAPFVEREVVWAG